MFRPTELAASSAWLFARRSASNDGFAVRSNTSIAYFLGEFPDNQLRVVASRRHAVPSHLRTGRISQRPGFRTKTGRRAVNAQPGPIRLGATRRHVTKSCALESNLRATYRVLAIAPTRITDRTDKDQRRTDKDQRSHRQASGSHRQAISGSHRQDRSHRQASELAPTSVRDRTDLRQTIDQCAIGADRCAVA